MRKQIHANTAIYEWLVRDLGADVSINILKGESKLYNRKTGDYIMPATIDTALSEVFTAYLRKELDAIYTSDINFYKSKEGKVLNGASICTAIRNKMMLGDSVDKDLDFKAVLSGYLIGLGKLRKEEAVALSIETEKQFRKFLKIS